MNVIEKLDSLVNKWQNGAVEADYAGEGMEALTLKDCADDLDALMPAIRQAMIDAGRYRWLKGQLNDKERGEWDFTIDLQTANTNKDSE